MAKVKRHSFLVLLKSLLLLVTSCDQSNVSKEGITQKVPGFTDGNENDIIQAKLAELFNKFRLSRDEINVTNEMYKVITDPDIGRDKGYSTYNGSKFYDLLNALGDFRAKKVIGSYLRFTNVRKDFAKKINNVSSVADRVLLKSNLDANIVVYLLDVKKLFNDRIEGKTTIDTFVSQMIAKSNGQIAKLREDLSSDLMRPVNVGLQLSDQDQVTVSEIKDMLLDEPPIGKVKDYKTYTNREFDGLLVALGNDKLKEIITTYREYIANRQVHCTEIEDLINKIGDTGLRWKLQAQFDEKCEDCLEIKQVFTKFSDNGDVLDDIPDPEYVYEKMMETVHRDMFADIKKRVKDIVRFDGMKQGLSAAQRGALNYIRFIFEPLSQSTTQDKSVDFAIFLSNLSYRQIECIANFHLSFEDEMKATEAAISKILDEKERNQLSTEFRSINYHKTLTDYLSAETPEKVYENFKNSEYINELVNIKERALKCLYEKELESAAKRAAEELEEEANRQAKEARLKAAAKRAAEELEEEANRQAKEARLKAAAKRAAEELEEEANRQAEEARLKAAEEEAERKAEEAKRQEEKERGTDAARGDGTQSVTAPVDGDTEGGTDAARGDGTQSVTTHVDGDTEGGTGAPVVESTDAAGSGDDAAKDDDTQRVTAPVDGDTEGGTDAARGDGTQGVTTHVDGDTEGGTGAPVVEITDAAGSGDDAAKDDDTQRVTAPVDGDTEGGTDAARGDGTQSVTTHVDGDTEGGTGALVVVAGDI
ncbi:Hypothetical protein BCO_0004401 (plasmid) [Borrelia coriaceae ATCC 43381]|uniref:Uncharacterized protein n=1 Tax=Borrelia coriaceae ATCC 43381 TaxID=1408429 RepID=W5T1C4_9SPIR|nr:hypothetical protein [Borrelia coriaceae]AHH11056.1 Hypothetical protein BCO_0004401 [Borrelia coriaceae ATCC 43381]